MRLLLAATMLYALLCVDVRESHALTPPTWDLQVLMNPTAAENEQVTFNAQIMNASETALPAVAQGDPTNCVPGAPEPPAVPSNCWRVTARFPPGLTAASAQAPAGGSCTVDGGTNTIACDVPADTSDGQVRPRERRVILFTASVDPGASGTLTSDFEVSGGGAPTDTTVRALTVSNTSPPFAVAAFDGQVSSDEAGAPLTHAGGHPYDASASIEFLSVTHPSELIGPLWPIEPVKTIVVDLPPGLVGSTAVVDQCTLPELANMRPGSDIETESLCPTTSQVGTTLVRHAYPGAPLTGPVPVFNMVPPPDAPARFGFNVFGSVVVLDAELRSEGDYGLSIVARNVPEGLAIQGSSFTLWGVPFDESHDFLRACPGAGPPWMSAGRSCSSRGLARKAFIRNPTMCTPAGVGLPTTMRADSWYSPGRFITASFTSHLPPAYPSPPSRWGPPQGPTDCDRVPFVPTLRGSPPAGAKASEPSGFSFDLTVPQSDDPDRPGTSDLRKAVVTLPQGVRVSPSSANGLGACSSEQIGLDSREEPDCPTASKVGTLTITTPLLREPLQGSVFLATPFDNPFDSLIAIYLVARAPGVVVKLPGHVSPDPMKNGQLTATFDDQPQLPFSNLHLEFEDGPFAPIVLPKKCGTYTTHAELTGWSGRVVTTESSFSVDQGCGGGFRPGFDAGTQNPVAGRSSPFLLRLTRSDADEELRALTIDMPRGLTGRISDVDLCGELDARNGTCRESARVGSVTVGSGAGPNPFYITSGRAYLTDAYRGCDFGLSIVVPAVAGPFDLGVVVVRSSVCVDKHTAELTVTSDDLPTQLQGIPLDVKDVRVSVDREGFFLNPTSCEEKAITGVIESTAGSRAGVSSRFQVGDCAALPLRPRMSLVVGGRRSTRRGRTTPLTATLRQGPGQAGLSRVRVTLPTTINARLTVINDACTRAEFEAGRCEDARTGTATAKTPLLDAPLTGGVYFVRNGHPLPDLFVALRGQVDFDLIGRITIPGSKRLRTSFNAVPDVPVSSFQLRLNGGRQGSVGNAANLCSRRGRSARAELSFTGQNGKQVDIRQRLKIRGCRGGRGRRSRRRGRR